MHKTWPDLGCCDWSVQQTDLSVLTLLTAVTLISPSDRPLCLDSPYCYDSDQCIRQTSLSWLSLLLWLVSATDRPLCLYCPHCCDSGQPGSLQFGIKLVLVCLILLKLMLFTDTLPYILYMPIFSCFVEKNIDGKLTVVFIPEAEDGKRVLL